jgi:predicted PurR-regulated permease PerM
MEIPVAFVAKIGIHRKIATGIVMLSFLLFLVILGFGAFKAIGSELNGFMDNIGGYLNTFLENFNTLKFVNNSIDTSSLVDKVNSEASHFMSTHLSAGLGIIFDCVTIIFFTYYLVSEGYLFRKTICKLLPEKYQNFVLDVWEKSIEKSGAYIVARIILALFSSIVFTILGILLGLPYPFILGFWYGFISQAIPVIGTYTGGLLIVVVAANRGADMVITVLVAILLFQLLADYLILPKISKFSLNIHPALMMLSVLIGSVLFGPVGALIGIPIVAIISSIFTSYNFLINDVVNHKLLEKPSVSSSAPLMKIKNINLKKERKVVAGKVSKKKDALSKPTQKSKSDVRGKANINKDKNVKINQGKNKATQRSNDIKSKAIEKNPKNNIKY